MRATERVVIPKRGAMLGNFGVATVNEHETWVTVGEGMYQADKITEGADGSVFAGRILWSKPKQTRRRGSQDSVEYLQFFIGIAINWGVRRFASWSRIPLTILALVGLAAFPIGTVFGGLILRAFCSPRQPKLLSKKYERIVKATPEMNDPTSAATWLFVFLLIVLVLAILLVSQIPPEIRHTR